MFSEEDWNAGPAHGDGEISMGLCYISNNQIGLVRISRDDDFIPEEILHHANIVNALVGFSIFTHVKTIMGADELEVRFVDIVEAVLIICFVDAEDAEVSKEREKTESGNGSCNGCCIMLLNSALEEVIWKLFGEPCRFYGGR